ncbi:MAG: DUF6265 family protein [Myxococcota bacterium]
MWLLVPLALADPASDLAGLGWLAGEWRGKVDGATFVTAYTSPEGGLVLSVSKTIEGGRAVFHEFERFEVKDGAVVLTPYPGGRQSVPFTLTGYDPKVRSATFVNAGHDFPTEITYARVADDRLVVTLTGKAAGKSDVVRFELSR